MYTKEESKERIKELLEKYSKSKTAGKLDAFYGKGKEQNTKKDFIEPLFEALNWKVGNSEEVSKEETVLRGKVDYGFFIGGNPKFFVEAKSMGETLNETHKKQAIEYGINRGITWVVLTNFKELIIFNCEWEDEHKWKNQLFSKIDIFELFEDFDKLWMLSKNEFIESALDKYAEGVGKKTPRLPIDKILLQNLLEWRRLIANDISKNFGNKYSEEDVDEQVQRLLCRLIFIRNCEDRGFEEKRLMMIFQAYKEHKKEILKNLLKVFEYYNEYYDSKIFELSEIDRITKIDDSILNKVIWELYYTKDEYKYDFNVIPSDVIGRIYEQYLGHILRKTSQHAKLKEGTAHRKESGIYYTPDYIVDYIVKNTLGEILKDKKVKAEKLRILDPACGSGSFLIKAFDTLNEYYSKKDKNYAQTQLDANGAYTKKIKLLKNNIFGVDLDKQAVEIAQLSLLLKVAEKRQRLPELRQNIQCGNSLIDDPEVAGDKAFKWEERFKDVMDEGGFDIIIGNPPYVKARDTKDPISRKWMEESGKFETLYKMWDLYVAFVEKGIKLLKPKGCFAMIIPDTIGEADYTSKLVELIINKYSLYQIDFFPDVEIFSGVGVKNKIIFIKNTKRIKECKRILHENEVENTKNIEIMDNRAQDAFRLRLSKINLNFKQIITLEKICYVSYGARFNSDKNDNIKFKKEDLVSDEKNNIHNRLYTEGKFISRYKINKKKYVEWGTERCPKRLVRPTFSELYPPNKLLMSRIKRVTAYSEEGHICDNTIIVGVPYYELRNVKNKGINKYLKNIRINRETAEIVSKKFDLKYILAILNSKLIKYFLNINSRSKLSIYPDDWKKIPIKDIDLSLQQPIINLADKMLLLNKHLNEMGGKITDERARIEEEIKKTDEEIDELVYKIYGITEKEKKIIEESL